MITLNDKIAFWRGTARFDGLTQIASQTIAPITQNQHSHGKGVELASRSDQAESTPDTEKAKTKPGASSAGQDKPTTKR